MAKTPTLLPDKLFFKIGEVADLIGVKPHVLRYWESEFSSLRPMKTRGAHRVYKKRDVELAMFIRRLLQDEGYTIAGARKRIREEGRDRVSSAPDPLASRELALRAELLGLRASLSLLREGLHRGFDVVDLEQADSQVTVHAVTPTTLTMAQAMSQALADVPAEVHVPAPVRRADV